MDERQEEKANETQDGMIDSMEDDAVEHLWNELHGEAIDQQIIAIMSRFSLSEGSQDILYNHICLKLAKKLTEGMS